MIQYATDSLVEAVIQKLKEKLSFGVAAIMRAAVVVVSFLK